MDTPTRAALPRPRPARRAADLAADAVAGIVRAAERRVRDAASNGGARCLAMRAGLGESVPGAAAPAPGATQLGLSGVRDARFGGMQKRVEGPAGRVVFVQSRHARLDRRHDCFV